MSNLRSMEEMLKIARNGQFHRSCLAYGLAAGGSVRFLNSIHIASTCISDTVHKKIEAHVPGVFSSSFAASGY